jgi:hypothetical protein
MSDSPFARVSKKTKLSYTGYFRREDEKIEVRRRGSILFGSGRHNHQSLYHLLKHNLTSVYCVDFEDLAMYGYNRYTQPSDIVLLKDKNKEEYMCLVKDESKTSWDRSAPFPNIPQWEANWKGVLAAHSPFNPGWMDDIPVVLSPKVKDQETLLQYLPTDSHRALYFQLKEFFGANNVLLWSEARHLNPDSGIQYYSPKEGVHLALGSDGRAYIGIHMSR